MYFMLHSEKRMETDRKNKHVKADCNTFLVIGACEFITFASLIEKYVTLCTIIIDLVYNTLTSTRLNR